MTTKFIARLAPAAALAAVLFVSPAFAQPAPTPAQITAAREVVELKGGAAMFDPVIGNVIEQAKAVLLQTNPQLSKDLNDVAAQLRTEFTPRRDEIMNEAARLYATSFTDQEIRDMATFYKSPLGKKMIQTEPQVLDQTFNFIGQWGPRAAEDALNRFRAEMKKKGHNL